MELISFRFGRGGYQRAKARFGDFKVDIGIGIYASVQMSKVVWKLTTVLQKVLKLVLIIEYSLHGVARTIVRTVKKTVGVI